MNTEPFPISDTTARLGRIAILWRGDEAARRSATARGEPIGKRGGGTDRKKFRGNR